MSSTTPDAPEALFVADNCALDFINTEYGEGARHCECFVDDQSVVDWLKQAGLLPQAPRKAPDGLLALALEMRAAGKAMVKAAKAGRRADVDVVNRVLKLGNPTRELQWEGETASFKVVKRRDTTHAMGLLEPVADAMVNLLTGEQLDLVRQCEGEDCTLLFHDLTKSHRRRWCSMAVCGNRMKVAAFRSRKKTG
jgi:predicted RNA-binding Zn ribbon-like protein